MSVSSKTFVMFNGNLAISVFMSNPTTKFHVTETLPFLFQVSFIKNVCHISKSFANLTFMSNSQKMSCLTKNQPFHFRVKSNHNDRHVNEISDNSVFHVKSNHNRFLCQIRPRFHVYRNLAISVSCQFRQKRCHV